jgi:integrase
VDLDDGGYIPTSAGLAPFGAVAEDWFASTADLKKRTRVAYRSVLDHNLAGWHGIPVGSFRYRDVQDVVDRMVDVGRRPSTVRNVVIVARQVFEEARKQRLIRDNPCHDLRLPRLVVSESTFLTRAQVRALAAELAPEHDLLILTAVGTGLRAGELAGLRVQDLELDRLRIAVRNTMTYAYVNRPGFTGGSSPWK